MAWSGARTRKLCCRVRMRATSCTSLPDAVVEIEPAQRAVPREPSAIHALFRAQFAAILDRGHPRSVVFGHAAWAEKAKGRVSGADMLKGSDAKAPCMSRCRAR